MSVLDMFASALGAFIIIVVLLFPYYNKAKLEVKMRKDLEVLETDLKEVRRQSADAASALSNVLLQVKEGNAAASGLKECKRARAMCEASLTKTFLVVGAEWDEPCDVDLYVTDPAGRTFSYAMRKFSGRQTGSGEPDDSQLSLDMRDGPGIEIWQSPVAREGTYKVSYNVLKLQSPSVRVRGWIIDRTSGRRLLPEVLLTPSKSRAHAANLVISRDGSTVIQSEQE
ncbi:hypothetical protein [Methylobacterium sp. D48H]